MLSRNLFLVRAGEIESLFLIEGDWLHFFLIQIENSIFSTTRSRESRVNKYSSTDETFSHIKTLFFPFIYFQFQFSLFDRSSGFFFIIIIVFVVNNTLLFRSIFGTCIEYYTKKPTKIKMLILKLTLRKEVVEFQASSNVRIQWSDSSLFYQELSLLI